MLGAMMDFVVHSLHLSADEPALSQVLRPLDRGGRPLRVLSLGGRLSRPLRSAGCEVYEDRPNGAPKNTGFDRQEPAELDAICAAMSPEELISTLRTWAGEVRPGGMIVLVTRRGRPTRAHLCAAFLHAGLRDPVQRTAGVSIITAGITAGVAPQARV